MKLLCLLVIIANLSLFLWEYRSGTFSSTITNSDQLAVAGDEHIFLSHESENEINTSKMPSAESSISGSPTTDSTTREIIPYVSKHMPITHSSVTDYRVTQLP